MKKSNGHRALCSACGNMDRCEYVEAFGPARAYCDGIEEILTSLNVDLAQLAAKPGKHEPATYKGLCSNCDNREECVFPKPEGGVWHCEEYC